MDVNQSNVATNRYAFLDRRPLAQDQSDLLQAAFGELEVIRVHSGGDHLLSQRLTNLERLLEKLELLNRATLMASRGLPGKPGIRGAQP